MKNPADANDLHIKPLKVWDYPLYFGFPAVLMAACVYILMPGLISLGASEYLGLQLASLVPYVTLFAAAWIVFRKESNPWSWSLFKSRFRLPRPSGESWGWALALVIFSFVAYFVLKSFVLVLIADKIILLPDSVPRIIDPRVQVSLEELAGGMVKGNWFLVFLSIVVLFFNIFGEELWWRGYLLPRQEVSQGKFAWISHGLLWTFFHTFKYWEWIAILPISLALAFVVQRQKNTWLGIIAHSAVNGLGTIGIFLLVIG